MILNRIPLKNTDICFQLSQDLEDLGLSPQTDVLSTLKNVENLLSLPSMKGSIPLIRTQDFLQMALTREEHESSWKRGKLVELLLSSLLRGETIGERGDKEDILSDYGSISVKIYSGDETRIQGGSLPKFIRPRTTTSEFFKQWNSLFWDHSFESRYNLRDDTNRLLKFEGKRLYDLKTLCRERSTSQLKNNWRYHKVKFRIWRQFLEETFSGVDHWAVVYISNSPQTRDGYIEIDWFDNSEILKFLSPLDRPPPLKLCQGGTGFRFNADKLKREVKRSDIFTSGQLETHCILQDIDQTALYEISKKQEIIDFIEKASAAEIARIREILPY